MTLMTVTYELQEPLKAAKFKALGDFANTYGLHSFRLDEKTGYLHLDYDASRLKEIVVEHVLRGARIPGLRKLEPRKNKKAAADCDCIFNQRNRKIWNLQSGHDLVAHLISNERSCQCPHDGHNNSQQQ